MKPGGKVITLTPDWKNTVKVFYEDYTHRTPFTMNSLNDIHLINGFDDVKLKNLDSYLFYGKKIFIIKFC